MVALLLQSDCRLLQALPSICEIPALFNQESIWLQEIENPQTIMCGSSCVSNHRNPSLRGEVLLMIPMECRRIVLFLSKLTLQQNPVNSLARNTIKWRKYIHALCETGFARTGYWGAAVFEPSITICFICWTRVATSQNIKDQSSEKHSSTPTTSMVPDCSMIW